MRGIILREYLSERKNGEKRESIDGILLKKGE